MRTYWLLTALMMAVFLGLFGLVTGLGIPILTDPRPWMSSGVAGLGTAGLGAAGLGVALLVSDVLLPVPATLVMVAHGALFGVVLGTLLSLVGGLGAAAFGFGLGRFASDRLHRFVAAEEARRADALLSRWGPLAVVVTRPVPILAESVAILAGTSPLSWPRFLLASAAGNLPAALLYALTGATAASLDNAFLMFGLVLLIAGLFWLFGRKATLTPQSPLPGGEGKSS